MLITAELGRVVAVSSSNQTTLAAWLNWLITQPTLTPRTLKQTGLLSFLRCLKQQKQNIEKSCFLDVSFLIWNKATLNLGQSKKKRTT